MSVFAWSVRGYDPQEVARRVEASELVASGYLVSEELELEGWTLVERKELQGWVADLFARA